MREEPDHLVRRIPSLQKDDDDRSSNREYPCRYSRNYTNMYCSRNCREGYRIKTMKTSDMLYEAAQELWRISCRNDCCN